MNPHRPRLYRRVRLFCEVSLEAVSLATGVSAARIAAIETGQRDPDDVEQRLIESFLRSKLHSVLETEGPVPPWLRPVSASAIEEGR